MSSPDPSPSPTTSFGSDDGSQVLNYTALTVALVALVVSMLQLILQYVLSAEGRSKCSSAAIGLWSTKNKQFWAPWTGKLYVRYARPSVSRTIVLDALRVRGRERQNNLDILGNFKVKEKIIFAETKDGIQMSGTPQIILTRRGREETAPTLVNTLHGQERKAADVLLAATRQLFGASPPTKATWCSLLCDMGLDLQRLPSTGEFIDAETIPAVLDAPPLQVRMSDLIHFGLLLEMTLVEVDELKRVLNMTGRHCSLASKYQDGLGMLSRYTPMAHGSQPGVRRASEHEAQMLCETADGMIYIGDRLMLISSWGYNSLYNIFQHVLRDCKGNGWQEMPLKDLLRNAEGDSVYAWGGKWANPPTPIVALLMAMSGNVGVSTAFPHDTIRSWEPSMVQRATRDAFQAIDQHPGINVAPKDIFQRIRDANTDIMVLDEFKTVSNYGCQFGGIRGWLSTNLAEFTLRISRVWRRDNHPSGDFEPVPILSQLFTVLKTGTLSKGWGDKYNYNPEEGEGWKLPATSMLWLQITLLDTWLARHTDLIMEDTAMPELTVPANIPTAEQCARTASQVLNQTTGWNPPRLRFCRMYLARLASGIGQVGTSFMSNSRSFPDSRMGWKDMQRGTADQWAMVDAVMTLRAACQHTRLMLLRDSSPLLRLRNFDPVLLLA